MANREYLKGDTRQRERAYSPAVKINGGTTIYMAGHTGYQDEKGETYPGNFDGQVRVAFERMRKTVEKRRRQTGGRRHHDGVYHRHGQRHPFHPAAKRILRGRPLSRQRAHRH